MFISRIVFIVFVTLILTASLFSRQQPGKTAGVPQTGQAGISRTMEEIMREDRQSAAQRVNRPFRLSVEHEVEREDLPQNSSSPEVSSVPEITRIEKERLRSPFSPQALGTSFLGATLAETGAFPPDVMGTVGPTQFIVAVNGRIKSFNKTTGIADGVMNADMDVFFSSVMSSQSGTFTSDPRIRYDRLTGKWIVIIIDVPGGNGTVANHLLMAVSNTSTITGSTIWTYFSFTPNASQFADYPTLGVDKNALYIGFNMFTLGGSFAGTIGYVVRKSSVLGAGPIVTTSLGTLATSSGAGPYTPQGVDNFDTTATEGYFIGVDNASFGLLQIRRVSNPGGSPTVSGNLSISVPTTISPLTVPHFGNTGGPNGNLDALDDRLFAAVARNGRIWTAHNIGVNSSGTTTTPTRDGSRWYEIGSITTTPSLVQSGTIYDNSATARSYWIPSIMVSGQGHAAIGMDMSSTTDRVNGMAAGRFSSDALGTMQAPSLFTSSGTSYNPGGDPGGTSGRRWGDYSYTSVDPNDDMTMWTIQQFCDATNSYGVQVVKLIAPPPASPSGTSPSAVALGSTNVNITVTGTSSSGSGFYDPGSAFPRRLSATVNGGGVTVNSITYTDPTHFTMNINIAGGAATGSRTISVTNPDSQSVTSATAIFTINPGCPTITMTPSTLPNGGAGSAYSQTIIGSGGTTPYTFSVTSGALPSGVTLSSSGLLSGTPLAAGTYNFTITATDSSGCPGNQAYSLVVVTCSAITLSPSTLPDGTKGAAYNQTITSAGGTSPYSYAVTTGTLPAGVTLSSGGVLAGTPTAAGTFNFTITATDANTCTGNRAYTLIVNCPAITLSPSTLSNRGVNAPYSQSLTGAGGIGPYTFDVSLGTLPPGLSLSTAGVLSGTPTSLGTYNFTITATDNGGCFGSQAYSLMIVTCPTIMLSPASLPNGQVGTAYGNQTITSSGGTSPYTYTVTIGTLPAGLSLSSGGVISGTPTTAGTSNFTVTSTDAVGCTGNQAYSVVINLAGNSINLTALGAPYTQDFNTLASSGTSSTVPTGWAFSESGTGQNTTYAAGTGSDNTGNTYSFGSASSSERAFGGLQSGSLIPTIGASFTNSTGSTITSLAISYTGEQWRMGAASRTDRLDFQISTNATSLTTGTWVDNNSLDFTSPVTTGTAGALDGNLAANRTAISATISGLSIANGASFWIRWNDLNATSADDGEAIDDFSLTPTGASPTNPLVAGAATPSTVTAGNATLLTGTVTPGTNPASTGLTVTGDLSTIGGSSTQQFYDDATHGDVTSGDNIFSFSATVTLATSAGAKSLPLTVNDAQARSGSGSISLTVNSPTCPTITLSPSSLPNGTVGTAYSQTITASGGTSPYTFAVTVGTLPAGLSLAGGGALSGTPTISGTSNFTVTATDANTCTGTQAYALTIDAAPPSGTISLTALGSAYTQDFTALASTGTSATVPTGWAFTETLVNADGVYSAGTGSSTSGDTWSFGPTSSSERAFGTLLSGNLKATIGANFTNNTGSTITSLAISYMGEEWRLGTRNRFDSLKFQLSTNATSLTTGTWTGYSTLDLRTPDTSGTVGLRDGNTIRSTVSSSVNSLSISNGATFWIRWTDVDAAGSDDGLAVDDFSLTPTGAPPPTNPTVTAGANPSIVYAGNGTLLTATVRPGTNPTSSNIAVSVNLSSIGGSGTQVMTDDGTNGDVTSGDSVYSSLATVSLGTTSGGKTLNVSVTDGESRSASTSINLTVPACPAIVLTSPPLASDTVGMSYSQNITASGGTSPYTFAVTAGTLPAGLSLSSAGLVSGTPTIPGTSNFTVTATDSNHCTGNQAYSITVLPASCPNVTVISSALPGGTVGAAYNYTYTADSGASPYSFSITSGNLPQGLTLSSAGIITGTPAHTGTSVFTVLATDNNLCTGSRIDSIVVICPTITLSPAALDTGVAGTAYSKAVSASGGRPPYSYTISAGSLPAGLLLSSSGTIHGTPLATGTFPLTITATDSFGCTGSKNYSVIIICPAISITPGTVLPGTIGVAYNQSLSGTGGRAPYSFALVSGFLPAGLSLSSVGVMSGTPTLAETLSCTIGVTDSFGCAASNVYSIEISTVNHITVGVPLLDKWNMVSVPVIPPDSAVSSIYPGAVSNAFSFSTAGGYAAKTFLRHSIGYWLKFNSVHTQSITGQPILVDTMYVEVGWNMIGSISQSFPVAQITSVPGGIVTSQFYGYGGSYAKADTIHVGKAYWVKANQQGKLILSSSAAAPSLAGRINIVPIAELPPPMPKGDEANILPTTFALGQNYPNPFNPSTVIRYEMPEPAKVTLTLYTVLGQEIQKLVNEYQGAGYKSVQFDANRFPSGMYFYKLQAGAFTSVRKMLLIN